MKKWLAAGMAALMLTVLVGCGGGDKSTSASGEKEFIYGTMAYGTAMSNDGLNPHESYKGWSTLRYGVGETLFRFTESMELEPWLATGFEQVNDTTVTIMLRNDVTFSNGEKMTGDKVKACLDNLIKEHDRAPEDLGIEQITAEGQSVTITTKEPAPALLNYLSDPYGVIIDMDAGVSPDDIVIGTGPYVARSLSSTEIKLEKNKTYWDGEVQVDKVTVKSITDGDTLTMALQNGEIDAAQGLPYASLQLFQNNKGYQISSTNTSRLYFAQLNYETAALQDENVRKAIAKSIDKKGFTTTLLQGNGTPAVGAFPSNFTFGNDALHAQDFDIEGAKELLRQAGYQDTDGDGYVEKDGQTLTLRWLTYTSRQELPLLAESAQATLKEAGIKVEVNATDNYVEIADRGDFDILASAFVAAPTGDPQYFFSTHALDSSSYNRGKYQSEKVESLYNQLKEEFDVEKRSELAIAMQQELLDDGGFIFASHLKMSFVMQDGVSGFVAHPSDYYEITAELNIK